MKTVLVISCHPDDMEIDCAGTLLKCKERGDRVVVCHLCNGNMGHMVIMPDELAEIRAKEAERGSAIGGFEIIHGGFNDLDIYDNKESRDRVVKIIRDVKPDFIITHYPEDYMPDHNTTSKLVFDASFAASVPHYEPQLGTPCELVPIYYMATASGVGFTPTEYVDITDYIDKKLEMVECHASQVVWLKDHNDVDLPEKVRAVNRNLGIQCGRQYAEGFRECVVNLKLRPERMLP